MKSLNKSFNKILLLLTIIVATTVTACSAQINNAKTETVKVYGNCDMCKAKIEKAGKIKGITKVEWNEDTKMATITYDEKKTNKDAILKKIALAGYDSDSFLAPDAAYNNLAGCCQYDRASKPVAKEDIQMSKMDTMAMPKATEANETNILQPVYDAYFLLKDALVKSDGNTTSAKAMDLQTVINKVNMENLSMDVHMVLMKVVNNLKEDVMHINSTKNIEQQRGHFTTLSTSIYELIKVAKPNTTVYYDHCPMYNDGKGADWLSLDVSIKNPYYGSMMMSCGKIVETIK